MFFKKKDRGLYNPDATYTVKSYFAVEKVTVPEIKLDESGLTMPLSVDPDCSFQFQHLFGQSVSQVKGMDTKIGGRVSMAVYFLNIHTHNVSRKTSLASATDDSVLFYNQGTNRFIACLPSLELAKDAVASYPDAFHADFQSELIDDGKCYISIDEVVGAKTKSRIFFNLVNGEFLELDGIPEGMEDKSHYHQPPLRQSQGYLVEEFKFGFEADQEQESSKRTWFNMYGEEIESPFPDDEYVISYSMF